MLIALYLLVGLFGSRFVRSKFRPGGVGFENERHNRSCDRNSTRYNSDETSGCNHYTGCKSLYNNGIWNSIVVIATLALWPLYLLFWFMLAERLPRPPKPAILKSQTEKFNEALALDPGLKSIVDELHETYKVKV